MDNETTEGPAPSGYRRNKDNRSMTPERNNRISKVLNRRQPDLTVVMENVHKPHNLAAIARSCDAVGIPELHAVAKYRDIELTQKAASGCSKWVDIKTHPDMDTVFGFLRKGNYRILTAHFDHRAVSYREEDYTGPTAIIVGAELDGVTRETAEKCDGSIVIPMAGMVQSLNVSVATALILFEAQRQREAAGLYESPKLDKTLYKEKKFEWGYPRLAPVFKRQQSPYPELDENGKIIYE